MYQCFGIISNVLPMFLVKVSFPQLNYFKQHVLIIIHKGWIAANQNVQDHPHTPHIYRLIVGNVLEDFGCHICGSYCKEE